MLGKAPWRAYDYLAITLSLIRGPFAGHSVRVTGDDAHDAASDERCCVCHREFPETGGAFLGGRFFCTEHREDALRAADARLSRSGLAETALLAAFVALVALTLGNGPSASLPTSFGMGLLLALVPAAIWLVFVYRQDRLEPEPWGVVLGVFALGGLLGHTLVIPGSRLLFDVGQWRHASPLGEIVASIGIDGTLAILVAYLAVRYSVYLTDEFDEPVDGIVYGVAACLGVATALNVHFVVDTGGVLPLAGATHIANTAAGLVAAGAILGFGLGKSRFDRKRGSVWLTLAFLLAAIVVGGVERLALAAGVRHASFHPWSSLAAALAIVGVVLLGCHVLTARMRRQTLAGGQAGAN